MTMFGTGRAEAITDDDFAELAREIGCHPADLEAIANVESSGFGWFTDGRIKILFEKHVFYKYLPDDAKRARAVNEGLARRHWIGPKKGGYREQHNAQSRYSILTRARGIDDTAAMMSISMGRFQIMGFNWAMCGFDSVHDMWTQFLDSEANQLRGFASYLRKRGLYPALRLRDFDAIEQGYNGGGLGGAYARKMCKESDRLRKGKWKSWRGFDLPDASAPPPATVLRVDDVGDEVRKLQVDLEMLGYPVGAIDRIFGPKTLKAVMAFQRANRLKVDGVAGPKTLAAIEAELREIDSISAALEAELRASGVISDDQANPQTARAGNSARSDQKGNTTMLGNHSKLYGTIVGGGVSWLVSRGLLPPEFSTPDMIIAMTTFFAALVMYFFPANKAS